MSMNQNIKHVLYAMRKILHMKGILCAMSGGSGRSLPCQLDKHGMACSVLFLHSLETERAELPRLRSEKFYPIIGAR